MQIDFMFENTREFRIRDQGGRTAKGWQSHYPFGIGTNQVMRSPTFI